MLKKYLQIIYSFWAKVYDFIDKLYTFDRKKVIDELHIKKGDSILEIGVGTGLNLPFYPKHCKVYGIDFSKAMLNKARQKKHLAQVELMNEDAAKLSFPNKFFDKAIMTYVLRVSPQPSPVLKEISRVLKPAGQLIILDRFKTKQSLPLYFINNFRILFGSGKDYDLKDLVKNTGFKIQKKKPFGTWKNTFLVVLKKD